MTAWQPIDARSAQAAQIIGDTDDVTLPGCAIICITQAWSKPDGEEKRKLIRRAQLVLNWELDRVDRAMSAPPPISGAGQNEEGR